MYSRIFELENGCGEEKIKNALLRKKDKKDEKTCVWGSEKKCQGTHKKEEKFLNYPICDNDETHEFSNWRIIARESDKNSRIFELENCCSWQ
jgi:hypothetical protein